MEIEFKFQVPAGSLQAVQKELRRAAVARTHMQARYFDTEDGALAANGVALRLRKEGRRWVQTVKALGDGPLHRLEHNVDLGLARRGELPMADARRHQGTPAGERLDALLSQHGEAPLVETFATDIWRSTRNTRLGRSTVELALDIGRVIAPASGGRQERVSPVCELELELTQGSVADLAALAQRWSQRHGLWFSTVSKAERGERLREAAEPAPSRAIKARPPQFAGSDGAGSKGGLHIGAREVQRAVLAACLAQILPNASEIAGGSEEAEAVHQLRVGIRRLRSALRDLDGLAPERFDTKAWEPPLVDAFRDLGVQRDRDVLSASLQPHLQAAGAPLCELPPSADAQQAPSPGDVVRNPRFQQLLVDLIAFSAPSEAMEEAATGKEEGDAVRKVLAARLNKLHRQLVRAGKRFEDLPIEEQHRARKRLKRLRYLSEFVAPLFDKPKAERYVQHLLPAQDTLGEYNDEVMAIDAYRSAAEQDPRAWFAVGWLRARCPEQAKACGKALASLADARKFWK
jgi:triphosphatase